MTRWLIGALALVLLVRYPTHAPMVVLLVAVISLAVWLFFRPSTGTVYHGHGVTRQDTAFHEAGHAVVAHHRGATDISATVAGEGTSGVTRASERNAYDRAIILAAGTEATRLFYTRNAQPSGEDLTELQALCRQLGITPEQAHLIARKEVAQHAREIRTAAERLNRRGRLS
jgi:hypothetical protein